jgi:hypothetical protein
MLLIVISQETCSSMHDSEGNRVAELLNSVSQGAVTQQPTNGGCMENEPPGCETATPIRPAIHYQLTI